HEFHQVIAGNVLDDAAAALGDLAVGGHKLYTDTEIAHSPERGFERPSRTGRQQAPDGGAIKAGCIAGQPLAVLCQLLLDLSENGTGLVAEGRVAGIVVLDPAQRGGAKHDVHALGNPADVLLCEAASRRHHQLPVVCQAKNGGNLLRRSWRHDGSGRYTLDFYIGAWRRNVDVAHDRGQLTLDGICSGDRIQKGELLLDGSTCQSSSTAEFT